MHSRRPSRASFAWRDLAIAGLAAALLPVGATDLRAQSAESTPVVQALPSRESLELSAALSRLGRNPRDIDALVDAGNAASALGDFEAAIGFFQRGRQLSPQNPRLLAGLAGAMVGHGDAAAAIPLFAQAEQAGAELAGLAGDRGLAHDLIGDPATAQRYYTKALTSGANPEVSRRLAISYAISGDAERMDQTLLPLLRKQDKAAWRAKAFSLAILGKTEEATKITATLLPARLAKSITPYLQYMPRLTKAQQAAAANLGVFPRASQIGQQDAKLAALDSGLVPAGQPLGPQAVERSAPTRKETERAARARAKEEARRAKLEAEAAKRAERQARVAPPEPKPARQAGSVAEPEFAVAQKAPVPPVSRILTGKPESAPEPSARVAEAEPAPAPATRPVAAANSPSLPSPAASPSPSGDAAVSISTPPPASAPRSQSAGPGFDLARLPSTGNAPAAPTTPAATTPKPSAPAASFGSVFGDLGAPETTPKPVAGAVDITTIEPPRAAPPPPPAPPPPSHPSRIWVQLGIGQDMAALAYDWRRLKRANAQLLGDREGFTAQLNRTNRLLTGPFPSSKAANDFVRSLDEAGVSGPYVWTSPAGEVVDPIGK